MTKTFRPFFSPPDAEAGADELLDEELPDELHAASTEAATRSTAGTHSARFRDRLILNPFNPNGRTLPEWVSRNSADPAGGCAGPGVVAGARASFMTRPYRGRRAVPPGPEPLARPGHDGSGGGHEDADEQEPAGDDPGGFLVEVRQQQGVLQAGERENREHHADDRALAAEDGHPGQQHDGDDGQLHADAVVLHGGGEPEGPQHPGQREDDAGGDEQQELDPLDPDPGVERRPR